jgi:hypothetical protein
VGGKGTTARAGDPANAANSVKATEILKTGAIFISSAV